MRTKSNGGWKRGGMAAALLVVAACSNSNDPTAPPTGGGGTSNLVVSASSPADGDGTITVAGTLTVNSGSTGFDELVLSQTVGAVGHEVIVTWDTSTYAVNSVQHAWGTGTVVSGFTQCAPGANPCDAGKVVVDFAGSKVAFTGQVLPDAFGGSATSTVTGTAGW